MPAPVAGVIDVTEGNHRLTGLTAVALLAMPAIEGATVLFLRPLLTIHLFVGLALIPVVALKLASTGYRFARYYTRSRPTAGAVRRRRSSAPPLRSSWPRRFIVWLAFTALHVLGHLLAGIALAVVLVPHFAGRREAQRFRFGR